MKSVFALVIFLFGFSKTYSQTKAETKAWIVEKISKYGNYRVDSDEYYSTEVSGDQQIIIISRILEATRQREEKVEQIQEINFDDINSITSKRHTVSPGNYYSFMVSTYGNKVRTNYTKGLISYVTFILDWNAEPSLIERFMQAISKLIEFNKRDLPKETFR